MAEYGHDGFNAAGIFIDQWGAGPYVIIAGGRHWHFEDSRRFGPQWLDAKGEPKNEFIPPESSFWKAWQRWVDEGRRTMEGKGGRLFCVHSDIRKTPEGDEITR